MATIVSHREGTNIADASEGTRLRKRVTISRDEKEFVGPIIPNGKVLHYSGTKAMDRHGNEWYYVSHHGLEGWIQRKHTSDVDILQKNFNAVGGNIVGGNIVRGNIVGGNIVGDNIVGGHQAVGNKLRNELHQAALRASQGHALSKHERELAREQMRGFRQQQAEAEMMARMQAHARGMQMLGALGFIGF